jgi:hypothetical protein
MTMTFQHLDTVLAFGAVMLAASLVITAGTQLAISLFGLRGANLRRSLADLFENATQDRDARRYARVIAHRVLRHPLISDSAFSRSFIRIDKLPFVPADAAGKLRWAGSEIPLQPWLLGALGGFLAWPATLAIFNRLSPLDICEYTGLIDRYVPVLSLCEHPWRSGAILGAIFFGLLSRWRLATSVRVDELIGVLEKLSAPAGGTLPDPAQRAMLVIAGERRSRPRPKMNAVSAPIEGNFPDSLEGSEGGVAVAVEKAVTQASGYAADARLEGLALWFGRAMERASQRFTLQARLITVVLSFVLVFAAHLDAIRLFQMLSANAQQRAQLAASADAMIKQAEQLPRGKDGAGFQGTREVARTAVPDVYRKAMVAVLEVTPTLTEQTKPTARRVSHGITAPPPGGSPSLSTGGPAAPNEIQISAGVSQAVGEGGQVVPAVSQALTETPQKVRDNRGTSAKAKSTTKEQEKPGGTPKEDPETMAAKVRAAKALETRPGFASREDAVLWLRATLEGDPALENLAATYEQEVNNDLAGDADKLIDHSASIKRELARTGFQLFPEKSQGWPPNERELPGLLISIIFLCLGAPLCYNLLRGVASLRPLPTVK